MQPQRIYAEKAICRRERENLSKNVMISYWKRKSLIPLDFSMFLHNWRIPQTCHGHFEASPLRGGDVSKLEQAKHAAEPNWRHPTGQIFLQVWRCVSLWNHGLIMAYPCETMGLPWVVYLLCKEIGEFIWHQNIVKATLRSGKSVLTAQYSLQLTSLHTVYLLLFFSSGHIIYVIIRGWYCWSSRLIAALRTPWRIVRRDNQPKPINPWKLGIWSFERGWTTP